jgi:hypothetical protein
MKRKDASAVLRDHPERIEMLMREESPGILFKSVQQCRLFIDDGEHMRDWPPSDRLRYGSNVRTDP